VESRNLFCISLKNRRNAFRDTWKNLTSNWSWTEIHHNQSIDRIEIKFPRKNVEHIEKGYLALLLPLLLFPLFMARDSEVKVQRVFDGDTILLTNARRFGLSG
jgi:hypothetical protein